MSSPNPNETATLPSDPPSTGTIDITNLVEIMKNTFVKLMSDYVVQVAVGAFAPLGWPVLGPVFSFIVGKIVGAIANAAEMAAFFTNTAIRKASQAADYIDAVNAKNSLPSWTTDAQYEEAEKAEMQAFRNFVLLTN
jgi:hypothetical protein